MKKTAQIYCLGNYRQVDTAHCDITFVDSIESLPADVGGLLLLSLSAEQQDLILNQLHASHRYWTWRVYGLEDSARLSLMADGLWDEALCLEDYEQHQSKLTLIHSPEEVDPLLGWLWLDNTRSLIPVKSGDTPSLYSYPLLESIHPDLESPYRYLMSEINRELLVSERLVDRVRVCGNCQGGHLNYVDVCPSCHDFDIESSQSLHCFTCGYVGAQDEFLRSTKLECPKCLTQLRHIGVDYDKPIETHRCNSCQQRFAEAETRVSCFSCDHKNEISDLIVRRIHQCKIGYQGDHSIRHGHRLTTPELMLKGKVDVAFFNSILVWSNKLAKRSQEEHLILGLYLPRLDGYGKLYGDAKMFSLTEQIASRLNGLFRETDICCQVRNDMLLVLMPHATEQSLPVLQEKIESLAALIEEDNFSLKVFAWKLPDENLADDAALWIQNKLMDVYAL
ncbi:hypothetical protein MIB92_10050 [Aestuariirhabdus sp. Z084]|uniref:TackOD1 domain-containing metal-binding protein n=1 Tax=Aestuariirhabdus haliotis TaxID=2918751 RepID=UPI00201B3EDA|nr:hypothetical protein [Aestuariirhabdus haliotis]MCL6415995.1 hypothetical protein [Aestuariirhabdus haliotis]MCL6419972.1 hypothetical protein [Aestuariirhabdus haliotis]